MVSVFVDGCGGARVCVCVCVGGGGVLSTGQMLGLHCSSSPP